MHMLALLGEGLWKVAVVGILLGAGLPALFALGIRFTAAGAGGSATATGSGRNPALGALGWICFAVVVLAIALGISIIVTSGIGYKVSFENVYPTFVEKKH